MWLITVTVFSFLTALVLADCVPDVRTQGASSLAIVDSREVMEYPECCIISSIGSKVFPSLVFAHCVRFYRLVSVCENNIIINDVLKNGYHPSNQPVLNRS